MQKILLNQARTDMILAGDVTTAAGMMLACAGSPVDDALLRRLEMAGVAKLVVQGKPVPGADMGYDAHTRARRLAHLFRAHAHDRFMASLHRLLQRHFQERA